MSEPMILSFEEIEKISLKELLSNRELQRDIHYFVSYATRNYDFADGDHQYNPNPIVKLEDEKSKVIIWQHKTFSIGDNNSHIYFFDESWPTTDLPDYLRATDIIPSGIHTVSGDDYRRVHADTGLGAVDIALALHAGDQKIIDAIGAKELLFNKPVMRVNKNGGIPEIYNSATLEWEPNGNQEYRPDNREDA